MQGGYRSGDAVCLTQGFVENYRDSVCQVEASDLGVEYWNLQAMIPVCAEQFFGQTARFPPKNETIILPKTPVHVRVLSFSRKIDEAIFP